MRRSPLAAAAATGMLLAFAAAPAHGQRDVLPGHLAAADSAMAAQGFAPASQAVRAALGPGASQEIPLELKAGMRYMMIGVCDAACTDLDLALAAPDRVLAEDRALDDVPVVAVADVDGTYTLRVEMVTCATSSCGYGVRVYQSVAR